jgi:hypothetical protein
MPEILTESFCERCGTRYTFESAAPKGARLKGIKVVSRGLRNFVMSDDTSMDEAMAAARNETDREVTSQQLDAFHKTFNFCMSCRQYTCSNCWNEIEGRCLSCAPHLGHEILPAPFPNLAPGNGLIDDTLTADALNGHAQADTPTLEPMAWPTSDLMREEEAAGITFEDVIARQPAEAAVEEDETFDPLARLAELDAAAPPEPVTAPVPEPVQPVVEPEPVFVASEPEVLLAEPEPLAEAERGLESIAEPEPEPESIAEPEPEPVFMAEPEPEPEPAVAAEPAVEPEPPVFDDRAAAATAQTTDLFNRFRAEQNLDDAIAAYELTQAAADALADEPTAPEPEPLPEPVAAAPEPAVVEPEPAPIAAPEPVAAAPEPIAAPEPPTWIEPDQPTRAPEPVAAEAPIVPPSAPHLDRVAASASPTPPPEPGGIPASWEPVAADAREDVVPQPTWQIVAPDTTDEPQWPSQPAWPDTGQSEGLPFFGRPAQPTGGIEALWAESAREVTSAATVVTPPPVGAPVKPAGGVQPCVSCGLSLSANARFCRRCGTRQD